MNNMRIGIDARFYGGEQSKGLGRYTQKLIENLARLDKQNEYYIFLQEQEYKTWNINTDNFNRILAPYHWYSLTEQLFLPLKIKNVELDFMHFPHFNVPLFYNGPFIVTIHDLIISRFPTERATTLGPWLYKIKQVAYHRVIKHAAEAACKIITVSNYSKQDIVDYFKLPEQKIAVTYEAADLKEVKEVPEEEKKKVLSHYKINAPFILYVGNAYPHKNLEILLEVVKIMKKKKELNWKLILVGKKDYFYQRLEQLAWAMDVEKDVVFTGFVPDHDLPALYQEAIAYIFPSRYEGFGLPPLEAMSNGTPVLSSKQACLPEILGDAALYFEYQDVYGIINQIEKIIKNQNNIRRDLITRGLKKVREYSWERMARQTLRIYEQTLKNKI
jgi:glycosyltransferase involved in cell wall biosynthesis